MASRRDELNAYTFSRRRTVAAFLRPSSGGDDDEAPRALRAFMPSLVLGAVAVAAFGAYGIFKPTAPQGWQKANAIIVGKQSTARYVMLTDSSGKRELHPVLNLASAKLLLSANSTVEQVDDSILNSPSVLHGAAVGIPYAPDWLPDASDAGTAKLWAACDQGGTSPRATVAQSLLVLNGADSQKLSPARTLGATDALLVQTPDGNEYLVDSAGKYHQLAASGQKADRLAFQISPGTYFGGPEQVSASWLATLEEGQAIGFPSSDLPDPGAPVTLDGQAFSVGMVVQVTSSGTSQKYVVTRSGVQHVSDFTARLLEAESGQGQAQSVTVATVEDNGGTGTSTFEGGKDWPAEPVNLVNSGHGGARLQICSTYTTGSDGSQQRGVWAATANPFTASSASSTAYITPGTGLLYREISGTDQTSGKVYLLTQNGIKHPVQVNSDAANSGASAAPDPSASPSAADQSNGNLARLGYNNVQPVNVPYAFSTLLSTGPTLDTADAQNQQNS